MLIKLLTATRLWVVTCFLFFSLFTAAQQKTVTGKVTDAGNQPIYGASVSVRGTNTGTVTDDQGRFTITVPNDQSVLTISYVGLNQKTYLCEVKQISTYR